MRPEKIPRKLCIKYWWQCRYVSHLVSRQPLIAEAGVWSQASLCRICSGQTANVVGLTLSTSVFPCHFHDTNIAYLYGYFIAVTLSLHKYGIWKRSKMKQSAFSYGSPHGPQCDCLSLLVICCKYVIILPQIFGRIADRCMWLYTSTDDLWCLTSN